MTRVCAATGISGVPVGVQMAWPLITAAIPNSDQLLVVTLDRSGDVAKIFRM